MDGKPDTKKLVDHLFRHESGRMVAVLTRLLGLENLELAQDVVQEAFLRAMQTWAFEEIPRNPAGWLMRVARNRAIDLLRHRTMTEQHHRKIREGYPEQEEGTEDLLPDKEISDSQLQMIFACCHPALDQDDQVALTLNAVSGFGAAEIARALLTKESTIQKRLYRAKQFIRQNHLQLEIPAGQELIRRLDTVYTVIYLLFNEGYNSTHREDLIRKDLCAEAMRLGKLLSEHPAGNQPRSFALLSLMCFHASRFDSRLNKEQEIILLEYQDRSRWDQQLIALGYHFLAKASTGEDLSIYHIEAAIAAEHCLTRSFSETNWPRILELYDLLLTRKKSNLVLLNRAVVLAQTGAVHQALEEILAMENIQKLTETQYLFGAVLGDIYLRAGYPEKAREYLRKAYTLTHSRAERKLIETRINRSFPAN